MVVAGVPAMPASASGSADAAGGPAIDNAQLAKELKAAVQRQEFAEGLVDLLPPDPAAAGMTTGQPKPTSGPLTSATQPVLSPAASVPNTRVPNADVAVIALDSSGQPTAAANIVLSKDYPNGATVPVDSDLGTTQVRWRRWNTAEWDAGSNGVGGCRTGSGRCSAGDDVAVSGLRAEADGRFRRTPPRRPR